MQTRTLNDRYRLDELIGEGGMAVVYRGYDLVLNRDVAVKLLRDQYGADENFLARFDREAQSAARLSHPNIVNVYDVGQDDDVRYIVMEHIDGPNLKDLIRRQGPFSVEGAALVIRQIANGLDYAHARGLVHRDIKPQNILVDEDGNVKVVDFGIAKGMSDSNLTETGTGMGTVHYVSPEQARGEQATPLSDVYATGVVLYEMLTKTVPFEADSPVGVAMQHVSATPRPPSEINPSLPAQIDEFMDIALAKNPTDRFGSAGELARALESLSRGEPVTAATRAMAGGGAGRTASAGMAGAAGAGRAGRRRDGGRSARGLPPRSENFRDDVGCITWLIGSAILIGLIGLVILAFRLGDFGLFEPTAGENPGDPTPTEEVAVEESPTEAASDEATPTPESTPTPDDEGEMARVPELVGATLEQAEQSARFVGDFELDVEDAFSETVPEDEVIAQDPVAGTELERGSTIRVQVSRGPELIDLPDVEGVPLNQALAELEEFPISIEETAEPSQSVPEGQVIRLEPSDNIRNGDTVTVVVSRGNVVQVPDVFAEPLEAGIAELRQAGLVINSQMPQNCEYITERNPSFDCDDFQDGHIVSAAPNWNTWVPQAAAIDIAYYVAGDSGQGNNPNDSGSQGEPGSDGGNQDNGGDSSGDGGNNSGGNNSGNDDD